MKLKLFLILFFILLISCAISFKDYRIGLIVFFILTALILIIWFIVYYMKKVKIKNANKKKDELIEILLDKEKHSNEK